MIPADRKKMSDLRDEVTRWQTIAMDALDMYSDLLTAAGVQGHSFFRKNSHEMHDSIVARISCLSKRAVVKQITLDKSKPTHGGYPSDPEPEAS